MTVRPASIAALRAHSGPTQFGEDSTLPRCQAKAKSTGEQCRQIAMKGKRVCRLHGGHSKGPGKRRSSEGRSEHHLERQLPRRAIYAELKERGAVDPSLAALAWVREDRPDLYDVKGARVIAALAFDAYEGGAITWNGFRKELAAAELLIRPL